MKPTLTGGGSAARGEGGLWRLEIPPGPAGRYRLAQLDDYAGLPRRAFPWQPPAALVARARASAAELPGTWGFGFWNDPFGTALVRGGGARFPALPNAAWFFFASPPNYLTLREDLPARGALAAVFRSPRWPFALLALGAPALPLLLWAPARRLLRSLASRVVRQEAASLALDPADWHAYAIEWQPQGVRFLVDGEVVLESAASPMGPLGRVMWIDNQYAALPADGRPAFGTLANEAPGWIEVE